jgi:hypothetical protein
VWFVAFIISLLYRDKITPLLAYSEKNKVVFVYLIKQNLEFTIHKLYVGLLCQTLKHFIVLAPIEEEPYVRTVHISSVGNTLLEDQNQLLDQFR